MHAVQRSNLGATPWVLSLPFTGGVFTKLARLTGQLAPEAACLCLKSAGRDQLFYIGSVGSWIDLGLLTSRAH